MINSTEPLQVEERYDSLLVEQVEALSRVDHSQDEDMELLPLPSAWESSVEFEESDAFSQDGPAGGLDIDWGGDLNSVSNLVPLPAFGPPVANGGSAKQVEETAHDRSKSDDVAGRHIVQSLALESVDDQVVKEMQGQDSGTHSLRFARNPDSNRVQS